MEQETRGVITGWFTGLTYHLQKIIFGLCIGPQSLKGMSANLLSECECDTLIAPH